MTQKAQPKYQAPHCPRCGKLASDVSYRWNMPLGDFELIVQCGKCDTAPPVANDTSITPLLPNTRKAG